MSSAGAPLASGSLNESLAGLWPPPIDAALVQRLVLAALLLLVGFVLASWARRALVHLTRRRFTQQQSMIAGRAAFYGIFGLALFEGLHLAGVNLSVLLGAAGLLTVAIGFAAQTSASNLISGLFLMAERPFVLGDSIDFGGTTGEVVSIDLLSVKLRTFDNLLVRLPNEALLKAQVTNLTRYPIRRIDLPMTLSHRQDPAEARRVFEATADDDLQILDEPKPMMFVLGFGESGMQVRFSVWAATANFLEAKNRFLVSMQQAFRAAELELVIPRRDLRLDEPVRVRVEPEETDEASVDKTDPPEERTP